MKRKFYDVLLDWKKKRADKYAVLIDGARRVGKSWIAEAFGKHEYEKYVQIDFSKASLHVALFGFVVGERTDFGKTS